MAILTPTLVVSKRCVWFPLVTIDSCVTKLGSCVSSVSMTKLLETAIQAARQLTPEEQDEIARAILALADAPGDIVQLTGDERAAIERSKAAAAKGELASDAEVAFVWAKHGR